MTWIEETEMNINIFNAVVHSDQDKLLEYHRSPGLPSDVVFFAVEELHGRRENEDKRLSPAGKG